MKIIPHQQGSKEWLAHRATHFNASDAPAMMGASPYKTRTDLLREMATGGATEVDEGARKRFADGHRFEALARPVAEQIIGESLYPVTGEMAEYSASFDGLTMDERIVFEHKTLNDAIRAAANASELDLHYRIQMEQQLMICGGDRCLFMASIWDDRDQLVEEVHHWYEPDPKLRAEIGRGWIQFKRDLADYQHIDDAPAPEGKAPESLPALRIEMTGMVTASNLAEFKAVALSVIGSVKTDLQTDQDFADAEKAIKWSKDVADRLDAAKQHALSQTADIDALFRTLDEISAEARSKRLELEKLVKARKESIRTEIQQGAVSALRAHYQQINSTFAGRIVLNIPAIFGVSVGNAMKGKKTVASLRDAADTELAAGKIEANQIADRARVNLQSLDKQPEYAHLFPDFAALVVNKDADDMRAIIYARIEDHKAAEAKRIEAERERIQAEERARIEREEREKIRAEQQAQAKADAALAAELGQAEADAKDQRGKANAVQVPKATGKKAAASTPPKQTRPSDSEIIEVLALHYRVHESKVIEWLYGMDLDNESAMMVAGNI